MIVVNNEELPDLQNIDVQKATIAIQKAYKNKRNV